MEVPQAVLSRTGFFPSLVVGGAGRRFERRGERSCRARKTIAVTKGDELLPSLPVNDLSEEGGQTGLPIQGGRDNRRPSSPRGGGKLL